jgi:non-specific serine/threonine protein kinase
VSLSDTKVTQSTEGALAEVSFGEWLKRRRSALGLTQEQLARQLHCSTSALRKFEAELRRPSADVLERLADIFNIPQEQRKSFLRFARGDWQAISESDHDDPPWLALPGRVTQQVETGTPRNNLPLQLTSFIGREKDQAEITDFLAGHRLVTLVGAGGIGKTRLSLEVAHEALNTFPDGLWFIELAPLSDAALVPQAVVNTLGLIEQANRSPQTILTDFLKDKQILLILDNCEHLIQACAQLTEALLRACPNLKMLATSREALGVSGEFAFNVATLSIPDIRQSHTAKSLTEYEAVRLFLDRAQTTVHNFTITQENSLAIAQICHYLDGIPLALELAAARLRGLSVDQIAARLDDRFRLLTSGERTVLPRHQTLQALIDWSHDLLTAPEQRLLRRLSVFAGGWTLEAAEVVCAGGGFESDQILDLLLRLVDKSLVVAKTHGSESRYHMLETIRQYAREKLWAAGEGEMMRQRHLAYYVELAERAEPHLRAFDMVMWLDRLEAELDNIRVALEWALENDVDSQLRMASALLWFWHIRGHRNEGLDWLERGLPIEVMERADQPLSAGRAMLRGKALNASGILMTMFFNLTKAPERLKESLALFQQLGDAGKRGAAYALWGLAGSTPAHYLPVRSLIDQSLTLFREIDDKFGMAECLMSLTGYLSAEEGDYKQAAIVAEEQLALRREIGDEDGIAIALDNLSSLAFEQGDYERAIALHDESLSIFRRLKNKWAIGYGLSTFGEVFMWQGDYEGATNIYQEALAFAQDISDAFLSAYCSYSLATLSWVQDTYSHAAKTILDCLPIFHKAGNQWMVAGTEHTLGDIAFAHGDLKAALEWYETEMRLSREMQITEGIVFALNGMGKVAWISGVLDLAEERFSEVLKISREKNLKLADFHALYGLGRIAQLRGIYTQARAFYREALKTHRQPTAHPFHWVSVKMYSSSNAYPLVALAALAILDNQVARAVKLFSASEHTYKLIQFQLSPIERAEHDQAIAAARAALGEEALAAAYEEGKKMTLDEAVTYALEDTEASVE